MEGEGVHERALASAPAVGAAKVTDEGGRRVGRPRALRSVRSARGEGTAEHPDAGVRGLDRVVAAREQVQVGDRGEVAPSGSELRLPEGVEVRLVADDHVANGRKG